MGHSSDRTEKLRTRGHAQFRHRLSGNPCLERYARSSRLPGRDRRTTRKQKPRREKARKPSSRETARWLNRAVDEGRATRETGETDGKVGVTGKGGWRYTHAARMRIPLLILSRFVGLSSLALFPSLPRLVLSRPLSSSVGARGSLGFVRAFITAHYFSEMLLTVTLRNDKLICSRSGRGGKVYRADEGPAHVSIDGESYRVRRRCGSARLDISSQDWNIPLCFHGPTNFFSIEFFPPFR